MKNLYQDIRLGIKCVMFSYCIANSVTQFHDHTHNDEFKVFYDLETNTRPINVAYVSPSVTSWKNMNPAYRIFTMDGDYDGSSHVSLVFYVPLI